MYCKLLLFILLVCSNSRLHIPRYNVDIIELNHKFDGYGELCFTQIIIWNWKPEVCNYHVEDWWMVDVNNLGLMPGRRDSSIVVRRLVDEKPVEIVGKVFRETKTYIDPEVADKEVWHESRRRRVSWVMHKESCRP